MTLKLKRYYERFPVGEARTKDTILRFKKIYKEIEKIDNRELLIEVGCGKGSLGLLISDRCQQYIGIDFSLNALKFAMKRRKNNINYVCADASFLPFKENIFNIILCSEVLEHIPNYLKVLSESFHILKPLGSFFITIPNRYNPNVFLNLLLRGKGIGGQEYDNPPPFKKLLRQLLANGFKVEICQTFYHFVKLSYFMPKTLMKSIPSLIEVSQNVISNLLATLTIFPTNLYVFIRARK